MAGCQPLLKDLLETSLISSQGCCSMPYVPCLSLPLSDCMVFCCYHKKRALSVRGLYSCFLAEMLPCCTPLHMTTSLMSYIIYWPDHQQVELQRFLNACPSFVACVLALYFCLSRPDPDLTGPLACFHTLIAYINFSEVYIIICLLELVGSPALQMVTHFCQFKSASLSSFFTILCWHKIQFCS